MGRHEITKDLMEKKNEVKILIDRVDPTVVISGRMNNVKKAEIEISQLLSECYFITEISDYYMGHIMGKGGKTIDGIRETTKVLINLNKDEYPRTIEIIGTTKASVTSAKMKIFDCIAEKISKDFNRCNQKRFRPREVKEGSHRAAKYVLDQLKPTPQLFYMDFSGTLNSEEENYENEYADGNGEPLDLVHKMGGVMAPHDGILYRGKVLSFKRVSSELLLLIEFVDFGNTSWVSFFECKVLLGKYIYPPHAMPCQLENIDQKAYATFHASHLLRVFRNVLNNNSVIEEVKTYQTCNDDELVPIRISISGIGDLGDYLVQKNVAAMVNDPFSPLEANQVSRVGSISMVYLQNGIGSVVPVKVQTLSRQNDENYIFGRNFKDDMVDSLDNAYECAKRILSDRGNDFLPRKTLSFTIDDELSHGGPSAGVAFCILILSECLRLNIPPQIIFTGTISKDGKVGEVGGIKQKLLASKSHGIKEFFVPKSNYEEATSVKVRGLKVKSMVDIEGVLRILH